MNSNQNNIKKYLLSLGFYPNKYGYKFLVDLISSGIEREQILPLKYYGYPKLGEKFGKKIETIEKDIQNAISFAFQHGDLEILQKEFGSTIDEKKGKPTNKQFVLSAIERLTANSFV